MQTVKNLISLIVLGAWLAFGIRLALNWEFSDFWDFIIYGAIMAFLFFLAMAGVSGAQSYKKAR